MANFSIDVQTLHNNQCCLWNLTVTNGEVVEIETHQDVLGSGCYYSYTPENYHFEEMLRNFVKLLYKQDRTQYEDFVSALDQATLNKYFKATYVPK